MSGWLYQTTRLTAANFLRGEIRRQQREQEAYMQSTMNEPDADAWPQIAPLLDDALAKLGERDRNAIVLRFFENKNLLEVGTALGASEDAAKMRVNRALEKLRKFFTKRGISLTTAIIAGAVSANSVQAAPVGLAATVTAAAAKGAAVSGSTLTLIKGALKIMAWTKKTAIVVGAGTMVLAGGAIIVGVARSSAGDKSTASEILQKVQATYDALSTYSDSGKSINETSGRSLTSTFAVKFARPDLYIIQGTQTIGQTSHTVTFWPADGQVFMLADQAKYFRLAENDDHILETSTGDSAASGLSVAGLFFHKNSPGSHWLGSIEKLAASTNVVRQSDEKVAGVNCYVLKMPVMPYWVTLWIGQKDFLIHQRRIVAVPQPDPKDTFIFTETHTDIVINQVFSKADLMPRIPAGVKLETKPVR